MEDISAKFRHLFAVISSGSFLEKNALGGEIPFFVSAYNAEQELLVRDDIKSLKNKLENNGIPILEINLYELVCDILEEKDKMDVMFQVEKKKSKDKFLRALQSTLNIHEILMPRIKDLIDNSGAKIYFLTGIGQVFPFIRSHNVLENLQNIAKNAPTVIFFPGSYDGHSLNLFGIMKDDNYYRAFNIEYIGAEND